jgi:hypothetical protein
MSELLLSIKADLLDRRRLPLFVTLAVALAAALAYAVLGGGSSPTTPPSPSPGAGASAASGGLAVTQATGGPSGKAVAETTSGASSQRKGRALNPFLPLPGANAQAASAGNKSAASSSASGAGASKGASKSSSSSSSSGASGGSKPSTPAPEPKPKAPSKPKPPQPVYHVAVLFGGAPAGTPPQNIQLSPYENLKRLAPLPSSGEAPLVFAGVAAGGKRALFTLVHEVILHGQATCSPSESQCQAIALQAGQTEELEYTPPNGQPLLYRLQVVSITSSKASAASARRAYAAVSRRGRQLLRRNGVAALPGLRYLQDRGVLVLAGHPAFGARAHTARRSRSHGR